jgi:hypothetical protein
VAREQAQAASDAIAEAAVASASTVGAEKPLSPAQRIAAEWEAAQVPFIDGWNIG